MQSVVSCLKRKQLKKNSQGLLAKYILEHKNEIEQLTVRELAERAFVSTAAATRLAKDCGFKGFSEFKYELTREQLELDDYQNNYTNEVVDNYIDKQLMAMKDTVKAIDYSLIKSLVRSILNNNQVIIFATGATLLRAMDFEYKLRRIGIRVISCMDFDQQLTQSKIITNSTTCIAVSYAGDAENVVKCINNLIDNNVECYYISTNNIFSNKVKHIKLVTLEPLSRNYSIASSASITCVLDLIFLELLKLDPVQYNNNLEVTKH